MNNSVRTKSNEILFCLQVLYQNKQINAEERKELTNFLKECLSNETSENKYKLYVAFQDIYYRRNIPSDIKQRIYNCMTLLE